MANRNFNRYQSLEKEVKALYAEVSFDALGAPTLIRGLGVASVALDSGDIKITLQDKYTRLLHVSVIEKGAPSLTAPVAVASEDVASAKTIVLSNSIVPLASTTLLVRIDVKNSSAQ